MKIYKIASDANNLSKSQKTIELQEQFFEIRTKGAKKIATTAKEKGGPSILTYWHFVAKEDPYAIVLDAINKEKPLSFYKEKCDMLLKKINVEKMTQKEFQTVMGELEVWGEAYCKLK